MLDLANLGNNLLRDVLRQSTTIFLIGMLVARYARLPARAHAVLLMTILGAVITPVASGVVRQCGWGVLQPTATTAAVGKTPAVDPRPETMVAPPRLPDQAPTVADINESPTSSGLELAIIRHAARQRAPEPREMPAATEVQSISTAPPIASSATLLSTAPSRAWPVAAGATWTFVALWFAGSMFAAGRLLRGVRESRRLMASAEPCVAPSVDAAIATARKRLGLGTLPVDVFQSSAVRCPMIWCWGRRPILLLPHDAAAHWWTSDWTPILCHELAHWRRRDHVTALAAEVVCCLLPWQPFGLARQRRLEQASEQACDDWAVASGNSAADYAETLLGLVAQPGSSLQLAALRRRSGLAARIHHILNQRVPRPRLGRLWGVAIVGIATFAIGAAAFCQRGVARAETAPPTEKTTSESTSTENKATDDKAKSATDAAPSKPSNTAPKPSTSMPAMPGRAMKGSTGSVVLDAAASSSTGADGASAEPRLYTVAGRVIGPDSQPVTGATVIWEAWIGKKPEVWEKGLQQLAQTTTDATGKFSIAKELIEKDIVGSNLTINAAGFGMRGHIIEIAKLDQPLEIQLDPSYSIEGSVFTPNGEPVKGAEVFLSQISCPRVGDDDKSRGWYIGPRSDQKSKHVPAHWPAPVKTDDNGQFRFVDVVPRCATAQVVIDAENFARTTVRVAHAESVHHSQEEGIVWREPTFTLVLENPWVVSGRFTDAKSGEGVPDVEMKVSPGHYSRGRYPIEDIHITTNKDGNYKLLTGSADYFQIQVRAGPLGYPGINNSLNSSTLEKLAGKGRKVNYNVKLQPGVILRGRVVAEDTGEPVADADVIYRAESGRKLGINAEFASVKTDADGGFAVTGTRGKGFLLVDAPDRGFYRQLVTDKRTERYSRKVHPHGILELDIPAEGDPDACVIPLKRGKELVVRALDPSGQPVKKLSSAYPEQELDRYFNSQEATEGTLRINAAEPGRKYRVFLFSDDAMAGIVTELTVPEDGHVVDVRLEPCATIRGRYVYAGDAPAADIHNFPKFVLDPAEGPDLDADDDQIHNLAFYSNFARVSTRGKSNKDKSTTGEDGKFELTGIVPGVHIYLSLNYKFEADDKLYRDVGALAPGEIKDMGDLVIKSR